MPELIASCIFAVFLLGGLALWYFLNARQKRINLFVDLLAEQVAKQAPTAISEKEFLRRKRRARRKIRNNLAKISRKRNRGRTKGQKKGI